MLDSLRRRFSHHKFKDFYNKAWGIGIFEDLVYYDDIGYHLPIARAVKKLSEKSFRYICNTSTFVELKGESFEMIECPAGKFMMGAVYSDENPLRPEFIMLPFLLGKTEVTQALYKAVMDTNPSYFQVSNTDPEARTKELYPFSLQHPVEQVSWLEAVSFCNILSNLQGLDLCYSQDENTTEIFCDFSKNGYRLPTDMEWEYAAKAGTQNRWSGTSNSNILRMYAIHKRNAKGSTHPVGSRDPNEWGFYDMSGNVQEWCWDKQLSKDALIANAHRLACGGSFDFTEGLITISDRSFGFPPEEHVDKRIGFRICRTFI